MDVIRVSFGERRDVGISESQIVEGIEEKISLIVDFGDGEVVSVSGLEVEGLSVYEVLEGVAEKERLELKVKRYDFGVLVEAIKGSDFCLRLRSADPGPGRFCLSGGTGCFFAA